MVSRTKRLQPRSPASFRLTTSVPSMSTSRSASWFTSGMQSTRTRGEMRVQARSRITWTSNPCARRSRSMRPPKWLGTRIFLSARSLRLSPLRWSGWPWLTQTYSHASAAARCASGISCERVQLPKYASPTSQGSVTRTGPLSWTIRVALPMVSKPMSMCPPNRGETGWRRPARRAARFGAGAVATSITGSVRRATHHSPLPGGPWGQVTPPGRRRCGGPRQRAAVIRWSPLCLLGHGREAAAVNAASQRRPGVVATVNVVDADPLEVDPIQAAQVHLVVLAAQLGDVPVTVGPHAASAAGGLLHHRVLRREGDEPLPALQQAEGTGLHVRRPPPGLRTEGAVATNGALGEIEVGLVADGAAETASA